MKVKTDFKIKGDNSLEILCVVSLPPVLEKTYSVTFSQSVRKKYNDDFLVNDHTNSSKQDFGKLLARLSSNEKSLQKSSELEK